VIQNLKTSIHTMVESRLATLNTGCPGIITAYDPATRLASVQPAVKVQYEGEDGETVEEALPVLVNVPVHFPGGRGWDFVWHLTPPETCWIKFSQSSIDQWLEDGKLSPSTAARRFSLSDAVAEVGIRDKGHPGTPCPADSARLGSADGPQITFDQGTLTLTLASINEVRILGGARVRIASEGDIYIHDRWVDPLGGDI
jgi:hypothetical protein